MPSKTTLAMVRGLIDLVRYGVAVLFASLFGLALPALIAAWLVHLVVMGRSLEVPWPMWITAAVLSTTGLGWLGRSPAILGIAHAICDAWKARARPGK